MPRATVTPRSQVTEGNDVFLTHRIVTADGTNLVQADLSGTITVRVFDKAQGGEGRDPNTAVFTKTDISKTTGGPGGGASVLDTLATTYWDGQDGTGYNFVYQLIYDTAASTGPYPRAGHVYLVQFEAATSSFGTVRWKTILDVSPSDPS